MKPLPATAFIVMLIIVGLPGCAPSKTSNPAATPPVAAAAADAVQLAPVVPADFVDRVVVPITIDGYEQADLMSRIEGYVAEVLVNIGDQVQHGQVLARLDMPEMLAEYQRQEKMVEQARANLASERAEVTRTEAHMAEQLALKQLRESELKRTQRMVASGALKEDRLNEAQYGLDAVLASVQRIEADVQAASAHVRSAEAAVEVAQAELEKTAAMMNYIEIRAPFDGIITTRTVDAGAFVRPPSNGRGAVPLFSIESVERLRGVVMLPIENAAQLQVGVAAQLHSVLGVPQRRLQSVVGLDGGPLAISRHAGAFHRGSRMMRAEIDILNPADGESGERVMKPGDYGKITIELRHFNQVPSVPVSAVGTDVDGSFVFRVGEDRVCRRVSVNVLMTHQEQAALETDVLDYQELAGDLTLRTGDQVVSQGLDDVNDGELLP